MPIPTPRPRPPPVPADEDDEPDAAGDAGAPKPLHRSPRPLCSETADCPRPPESVASLGATELARTDLPPRLSLPAVAPLSRAANRVDAEAPLPGRATLPAPAPDDPVPLWPPELCCPPLPDPRDPRDPSVDPRDPLPEPRDPLVEPLVEPRAPLVEPLDEPAPESPGAEPLAPEEEPLEGTGALAPGAAPGSPPGVTPEPPGAAPGPPPGAGTAGAGAEGVAGVPVLGPVHAHARLCHTRVAPRIASTAKDKCRARLVTLSPKPLCV